MQKEEYDSDGERMKFLRFSKIENEKILDIGFGNGRLSILAATQYNCQVTCIENYREKLEWGKNLIQEHGLSEKIMLEYQDCRNFSYKNNMFPVVACFYVLHHIDFQNREKVVKEIIRVAEKRVAIAELTPYGAEYFDKVRHTEENHTEKLVPIKFIVEKLNTIPNIKYTYEINKFSVFILVEKKDYVRIQ